MKILVVSTARTGSSFIQRVLSKTFGLDNHNEIMRSADQTSDHHPVCMQTVPLTDNAVFKFMIGRLTLADFKSLDPAQFEYIVLTTRANKLDQLSSWAEALSTNNWGEVDAKSPTVEINSCAVDSMRAMLLEFDCIREHIVKAMIPHLVIDYTEYQVSPSSVQQQLGDFIRWPRAYKEVWDAEAKFRRHDLKIENFDYVSRVARDIIGLV